VLGQILKRFIYADDIAIVADDAESLQTALSHVHEWASAFGLTINMGVGKTEAIFFTSGLTLAAATPALQLTCGGKRVNWATSYLYLGHPLRFDLSEREAAAGRLSDMASAYGCYFLRNRLIRRMPNMSQLQVLKTCVLGGANYLRGVRHMTAEDHAAYDAMALTAARRILGLPDNCSTALVWTLSGLMPSAAITAQARWALNCKTRRACVANTPAAAIMTGLRNEAAAARADPRGAKQRRPRANADRTASWLATEDKAREGYATLLGLPVLQLPGAVTHVARGIAQSSKVLGRAVAFALVRDMLPPADSSSATPRSDGSAKHAAALLAGGPTATQLGTRANSTAMSALGPGCSGSTLASADSGRFPFVTKANLGNEALAYPPFADGPTKIAKAAPPGEYSKRFKRQTCPLCGAAQASIHHAAMGCKHDSLRDAQHALLEELPAVVSQIWDGCIRAGAPLPALTAAETGALGNLRGGVLPPAAERDFLAYHLLIAWPWTHSQAASKGFPAAAALGAIFDTTNVDRCRTRRMAATWLEWAERTLADVGLAWNTAGKEAAQAAAAAAQVDRVRLPEPVPLGST
jgi:hypothetical protein